jgi:hypothetical protein
VDDAVELHADWNRHLVATDPGRRDLVISCGAALHHLLVALAAQGVEVRVERLPDPENSGHLATVIVQPDAGHPGDATLFRCISRRGTDRRRMSHRELLPVRAGGEGLGEPVPHIGPCHRNQHVAQAFQVEAGRTTATGQSALCTSALLTELSTRPASSL